jgi:hypothetical protein
MSSSSSSNTLSELASTQENATKRTRVFSLPLHQPGQTLVERTTWLNQRVGQPFNADAASWPTEVTDVVSSLQCACSIDYNMDWNALAALLEQVAHISHKDWTVTMENGQLLREILLAGAHTTESSPKKARLSSSPLSTHPLVRSMFRRILTEGNWRGARAAAAQHSAVDRPWAVLVTGVNGIRKTTSLYQPWFPLLLQEALQAPEGETAAVPLESLPHGGNSFFRQLDHMIVTLAALDFARLYAMVQERLVAENPANDDDQVPTVPQSLVDEYSEYKAAMFTRYRTVSELLGVVLLEEAKSESLNCLLETSGRDVAMFHYVNAMFPSYRKLALHFVVNDLELAKQSVDRRMTQEMRLGAAAISSSNRDIFEIVKVNQGGPYGSRVLEDVQRDSNRVWQEQIQSKQVAADWFQATIHIAARSDAPWTAQAVRPNGSLGAVHEFQS